MTKGLPVCWRCRVVVAVVAVELREDWEEDNVAATVFGLRKKGTAMGLASCVGGRWCSLGREGERRPEEGLDRLAFGAKITKQGNDFGNKNRGRRGCPGLGEEQRKRGRLDFLEEQGPGWQLC
ncbi:hypothetical protein NC652_027717 [Populus alba x Populus x berolinensis]|nr:hypothetical protein NC652_027717 [Populus alba x Populus x berolinensis]